MSEVGFHPGLTRPRDTCEERRVIPGFRDLGDFREDCFDVFFGLLHESSWGRPTNISGFGTRDDS